MALGVKRQITINCKAAVKAGASSPCASDGSDESDGSAFTARTDAPYPPSLRGYGNFGGGASGQYHCSPHDPPRLGGSLALPGPAGLALNEAFPAGRGSRRAFPMVVLTRGTPSHPLKRGVNESRRQPRRNPSCARTRICGWKKVARGRPLADSSGIRSVMKWKTKHYPVEAAGGSAGFRRWSPRRE